MSAPAQACDGRGLHSGDCVGTTDERTGLMTLKRYAAKRDGNEREIIATLQKCGAQVCALSLAGMPDLLVAYRGCVYLVEVKQPKRTLNAAQRRKALLGWPVITVHSVLEALAFIGAENAR